MSQSNKLIYDPVHGYMNFNSTCLSLIDSSIFKRLQRIKQLGTCYYIFPGASHNRFEHSLGVAYLAEKMVRNISYRQPELGINEREIELVKIAGLCHDLGHGPYSHAFDNEILPRLAKTNTTDQSSRDNQVVTLDDLEPVIPHEIRSCQLLKMIISEKKLEFTEEEICFIQTCIYPEGANILEKEKTYLYEIVSNPYNGIDVDKFDYLKRDPYNIGLDNQFNCERLVEEARVIDGHICFPKKLANQLLSMFSVRYNFLREICNHPVVKAVEYMITDAVVKAEPLLQLRDCLTTGRFTTITDDIIYLIELSQEPELKEARNLISRIKNRQLYHYLGELQVPSSITGKIISGGFKPKILQKHGVDPDDIIIQHLKLSYSNTGSYPLENVLFYDYADLDKSFAIYKKDLSMIMPTSFSEKNTIRLYSKTSNQNQRQLAEKLYETLKRQYRR